MTPNLDKLFSEADFAQLEFDYNFSNPHTIQAARLLATHGRALIEALEDIILGFERCMKVAQWSQDFIHIKLQPYKQLLATLEHDAKGQP